MASKTLKVVNVIILPDGNKKLEEELTSEERQRWLMNIKTAYPRAMGWDYEIIPRRGK